MINNNIDENKLRFSTDVSFSTLGGTGDQNMLHIQQARW